MTKSTRKQMLFPAVMMERINAYKDKHGLNFTAAVLELIRKGLDSSKKDEE